jgi:hypothetical protein
MKDGSEHIFKKSNQGADGKRISAKHRGDQLLYTEKQKRV